MNSRKRVPCYALFVFFCSGLLFLIGFRDWSQRNCYENFAKELGVEPTYMAIGEVLYSQLQAALKPGAEHDEVIETLEQIAPVTYFKSSKSSSGDVFEDTILRICPFPVYGIEFQIQYSEDYQFEEIRLLYPD